jgi:hemoglobin/transferrin/lactoferrin receptor protein
MMIVKPIRQIVLIVCLLVPAAMHVFAQDSTAGTLEQIIVTAQRSPRKAMLVPYSVSTVSNSWLENFNPRTTPDALSSVNGLFIQKTNQGGGSPFIRGLTGNLALILIDGIRLNNATFRYGPNQYLNTISSYAIHHIEVAKGTGSVQYGSDALGGVIQVFTGDLRFTEKSLLQGNARSRYMTGDMEKTIRADATYSSSRMAVMAGASYRNFGHLRGGDSTGRQDPSGYDEFAFDTKLKFGLSQHANLMLAHQFVRQQHVPVYHKIMLENFSVNEFHPQQRMLNYARLEVEGKHPLAKEMRFIASWQRSLEGRHSRKNGSSILRKEKDEVNTLGFTADIFSHINNWWSANTGLELYADKVHSSMNDMHVETGTTVAKRGLYPEGAGYGNYSAYSIHHLQYKKWILDAGLRFNTFRISIQDSSLGNVRITPSALVSNLALLYSLSSRHHAYISFSSGYRAPNVDDMGTLGIVDFRYELPASGLRPEKSQHSELGYKFSGGKISGTVAVYYMHLRHLITRIKVDGQSINGYPVYKKENTESAYIKGFEAEADWRISKSLRTVAGLAYAHGVNLVRNEPLRRIPPFNGRLLTTYARKRWHASVEYLVAGSQRRLAQGDKDDNRIPRGGTPGWQVLNLYAGYRANHFILNAGVNNIFNEDYRTHGSGINGIGRSLAVNVAYQF